MKKLLLFMVLLLMGLASRAQTDTDKISVSGHVLDSKGDNIPGATVLERGTTNGTATNSEGRFIIKVSPNSTLTFSAIGFVPQQVPVQGRTNIEVKLEVSSTDLSEIVVTGSRATEGRSNILTTSPVDVISPREIKAYAQTDVTQILTYVAPSFQSSRQTISDGTDHIDPASLRGLGPDQTLVLVNGKRRHSTALVNINGTVGRGSVGTDMNVIPPAAIKRIEVLRDGAAAQYGSDAIAGVINIQLKDDSSGVLATSTLGRHYEGDGELLQADANVGIGLGSRGFVNVSGQFSNRSFTNRSGEDTAPLIYLGDNGGNYPTVNTSNQPLTFQGGSNGTSNISFYSPGAAGAAITPSNPNSPTFTQADIDRASANRAALKAQDDELAAQRGYNRRNLRWGNSIQRNFGGFINAGFQLSRNLGLDAYLTAGLSRREGRASGFNRLPSAISPQIDLTLYPDGFLPFIEPSIEDRSILGGLRGTVLGFNWDLSSVYGSNSLEFGVEGSLNASLPLGTSPRSFEAGKIFFSQNTNNLSFVRKFRELGPLATLNLAFGGEYRVDNYEISAGEFSSYGFGTNGNNGRNVLPQNGTRIPVP
ncbi:MAG TPA: TonB-dependent receptor plug domain-containing protein, partial [Hymenobacter sp.]|nr:TonB-dependent receptor plug domain-containing protein [Hymenobacter sp.]